MMATKGYFSLIQYCPDFLRLEVANIGVLLFCPERRFLKAKFTQDNRRIVKFFGNELAGNLDQITVIKKGWNQRLRCESDHIKNIEGFQAFIASQSNEIQFSKPRFIQVTDNPDDALDDLFSKLFWKKTQPNRKKKNELKTFFWNEILKFELSNVVARSIPKIELPFHQHIEPDYGFKNGRVNLIQIQEFKNEINSKIYTCICRDAISGRAIYETPSENWGEQKLVILGNFPPQSDTLINDARNICTSHNVELFTSSDDLVKLIKTTAHDLPPELIQQAN